MAKANFQTFQREHPDGPLLGVEVVTKCDCGWETTARNTTLAPNALDLALLSHRIEHLEADQEGKG